MARLTGLLAAAAIVGATVGIVGTTAASASAQTLLRPRPVLASANQGVQARLTLGAIQGSVLDDHGAPVADAMVSALSPLSTHMTVTDVHGRFRIQAVPYGEYVLRVHHDGYLSTRREGVRVGPAGQTGDIDAIKLLRASLESRPVLAAGMATPAGTPSTGDPNAPDNHSEVAWRLRHIARSVLKDDGSVVSIADAASDEPMPVPQNGSLFGRAFDNAASLATNFFTATPFTGEVNFLTTSALRDGALFSPNFAPGGIAYMSIGAPAASGRWDVRASMSQSDVSSWIVAGTFSSRAVSDHDYGFGVTYSTQQYQNQHAHPLTLAGAALNDDSRNVGEMFGSDVWTLSPVIAVEYSARYSHYDYLEQRSLLSSMAGISFTPFQGTPLENTHVSAHVSQRMLAPGAEEFLAPTMVGPWLPPERTFTALDPDDDLRVERTRSVDVGVDHEFNGTYVVGVRRIQQRVSDQMVALFGLPVTGGPDSPGHYMVASAGGLDAEGWNVRLASAPTQRVRGSIDYTVTRAEWTSRGDMAAIAVWAPAAIRPRTEDVHDLTTSLETDLPQTATHVFLLYKVNTAYARSDAATQPALDYRFDVQVNQALPFMPFSRAARWEVLVGVRNLFRDPGQAGSIYDELLVVRPPKRMVGGVLIKF